ncbi:MAG: glycolate oxidase subunit GlcF, partial [Gammaproteobacteria bacterium]|nr:glycolate oxidase subunit GlcF [Gammaproteobacteria bacterium]
MQTKITEQFLNTATGKEADNILRSCVHCGFCTATCPTYQLLGDELDGPRGRIYLIKQLLEGNEVTKKTQQHLDRCLGCRSCETTCPSGVQYGRLVDIGRELVEQEVGRNSTEAMKRWLLRKTIPYPVRFSVLLSLGRLFRPVLPSALKTKIPALQKAVVRPDETHARKMLVLEGCAQSVATPKTNSATASLLNKLGIQLINPVSAGCCGAVSHHLSATEESHDFMCRNIDAWWPHIENGAEAIVITASGCGATVKDYGKLLQYDTHYADKARRVSELARDISEILADEDLSGLNIRAEKKRVAFHSPCTLQHGMKLNGVVESILSKAGFELTQVEDSHLCCGSAGTYSILQPALSQQLLSNKVSALQKQEPDIIATANIGCQLHIS